MGFIIQLGYYAATIPALMHPRKFSANQDLSPFTSFSIPKLCNYFEMLPLISQLCATDLDFQG